MDELDFTREESAERNGQRDYTGEDPDPTTLEDLLRRIVAEPHPGPIGTPVRAISLNL